jgi:O-glycosyl hydrolase
VADSVESWLSNSGGVSKFKKQPELLFPSRTKQAPLTIEIDPTEKFQTIDGFGASITQSSAFMIQVRWDFQKLMIGSLSSWVKIVMK